MNIDMQGLIAEMNALIVKIKDGSATRGEVEAFAAAAAELHERAVVLRYKAYEAEVFGVPQPEPQPEVTQPVETVPAVEEPVAEPVPAPEPVSTPAEPEGFDLFSLTDEEEEEPALAFDLAPQPAETPQPETPEPEAEVHVPEILEPETEPEPLFTPEPARVEEIPAVTPEPAPQAAEPAPVREPELPKAPETQPELRHFSSEIHPLYNRISTDDNSLAGRLMAVRLESLKGAFGFNERVQIVQELFGGSTEMFSEAIEQLDNLQSKGEARAIVTDYANRFSWRPESDLVMEFVQKVERRYA